MFTYANWKVEYMDMRILTGKVKHFLEMIDIVEDGYVDEIASGAKHNVV